MKVYQFIDAVKNLTEQRRQKRKAKHKAKRKGKIDNRTGKRGKASYSDRTDDAGMVTAGPGSSRDRPYAKAGLKRGAPKRSSFYYDKSYF